MIMYNHSENFHKNRTASGYSPSHGNIPGQVDRQLLAENYR